IVDSYRMTLKTLLDSYRMTSLYLSCCKHLYPYCRFLQNDVKGINRFLQNDIFPTCHAVSIYTRIVDYRMTLKALIDSYRMTSSRSGKRSLTAKRSMKSCIKLQKLFRK